MGGPLCLLPGQQPGGEPREEGPCELAVATAMAALEFDHWGPGVGVGSWYRPRRGREEGPEAQESQEEQRQGRGQGPLHGLSFPVCEGGRGKDLKLFPPSSNPNWNLAEAQGW